MAAALPRQAYQGSKGFTYRVSDGPGQGFGNPRESGHGGKPGLETRGRRLLRDARGGRLCPRSVGGILQILDRGEALEALKAWAEVEGSESA